jgi:hypothetical protein
LTRIRGGGCDIDKTTDLGLITRLGDNRAAPGMPDEQHRPILHFDRLPNSIDVVSQRTQRAI